MARASSTLLNRVVTEFQHLDTLYKDLQRAGDKEVADAVKRARRELEHPAVTASANQVTGVNSGAIRF